MYPYITLWIIYIPVHWIMYIPVHYTVDNIYTRTLDKSLFKWWEIHYLYLRLCASLPTPSNQITVFVGQEGFVSQQKQENTLFSLFSATACRALNLVLLEFTSNQGCRISCTFYVLHVLWITGKVDMRRTCIGILMKSCYVLFLHSIGTNL
jgi:hypothetical protein